MKKKSFLVSIIGFIIVFVTVCSTVNAQQPKEVRNAKGNLEYTIEKDGTIRLPNGKTIGKTTKDGLEIKDSKGKVILRQQNDRIVDSKGRTKYRVTPSSVSDEKGRQIAIRDSTSLNDTKGKTLYRIK